MQLIVQIGTFITKL